MASDKTLLYYGTLLHGIGKIVARAGQTSANFAQLGANLIGGKVATQNRCFASEDGQKIVEQIRYQSYEDIASAGLPDESLAYVSWFADRVASRVDLASNNEVEALPNHDVLLRKVFDDLNGHHDSGVVEHESYATIEESLVQGLLGIGINSSEVDSLLWLLGSNVSNVPAATGITELSDISLYDHAKTAAGIASCAYDYMLAHDMHNFRNALFGGGESPNAGEMPMFLLYSCDMSGVQDFIYNISGSGALKQLRARSMYLELLLEHLVDELLGELELSRANLLYTGGGHAYLLLPNTQTAISKLRTFDGETKAWFVDKYRNDLYVASAWVECSADDLANRGQDKSRYPALFQRLSQLLSDSKAARYDALTIRALNHTTKARFDHTRECSECHRSDLHINEDGKCQLCATLGLISKRLVDKDVFVVERNEVENSKREFATLELPFGCKLRMCTRDECRSGQDKALRVYVKGAWDISDGPATRIMMGDYTADYGTEGISSYAECGTTLEVGKGIRRLGVMRADVDDLGAAFASGLPDEKMFISRTSTLSRTLSLFFKSELNAIMERGNYQAQIIYSGGDDLFIVGNWSDAIHTAVDVRNAFAEYTGNGSLTLSAGVGMFGATYPIARIAAETGALEDAAKGRTTHDGVVKKDAIALWSPESVYGWSEFVDVVMSRKSEVAKLFQGNKKGMSFVYRIIDLLHDYDAASAPRLAYLLARSFESDRSQGANACSQLYEWAQDSQERRRLVTALEWYVYGVREGSER